MSLSFLKTVVIYITGLLIAVALTVIVVIIPAYVHMGLCHIPGAYDSLYLSKHSPYDTIIVEVDYQTGMDPDPEAIAVLKQHIELNSGKNVIIHLHDDISDDEVPGIIYGDDIFNVVSKLQKSNRNYLTGWLGGNITLYVIYLDSIWHQTNSNYSSNMPPHDRYSNSTKIYSVGATYAADSFIIFKRSIIQDDMEATILLHEVGHVWGLDHSNQSDNVMNAQFNVFTGLPDNHDPDHFKFPRTFSQEDKEELARLHDSPCLLPNLM